MSAVLEASGLGKRYRRGWALRDCTLAVPAGRVVGLVGPNGAGKTTLLRLIAGLLPPAAGAVLVDDEVTGAPVPVDSLPRRRRARRIALLEQESSATVPLLVREVVALGRVPYRSWWGTDPDDSAVTRALAAADASHLEHRAWDSLSGGERQRVHVARALAQEPELLLLDEPTNHLDVSAQLSLLTFVRTLGVTTVAALHDLNLAASYCDHVLVLSNGRLAAAGAPILYDAFYGHPEVELRLSDLKRSYKGRDDEKPFIGRLALHASELTLQHPATRTPVTLRSPLPHEFEVALKYLRKFAPSAPRPPAPA